MKHGFLFFTGIFILAILSASIATAAMSDSLNATNNTSPDRLSEILNRGYLVVAIEPLGAPYGDLISGETRNHDSKCSDECYSANQMTGFDIALTGAVARDLGVEACYVTPDHNQVYQGNWTGWDLFPGYYITNDRLKTYLFTQPIVSESSRFFVRTKETNISNPGDLSGRRIGVGNLTAQAMYLNNTLNLPGVVNENPVTNATIIPYENEYLAVSDLLSGTVDAVLVSESTGDEYIANGSPILGLTPVAFTGYSGLAITKDSGGDSRSLVQQFDESINRMHADGELSNISMTYLGKDITQDAASFDIKTLNQSSD